MDLFAHIARLRATLTPRQIATLVAAFVGVIAVVAGSAYWVNTPTFTVLYTDLDPDSAAAVVERLRAGNTPYRLEQGGRVVLVPAPRVDELRLDLAAQGQPQSGRIGFEIFDKAAFGTTDFLEQVNYRRGLEGEIARTIGTIADVASARVHIALPKDSLFVGADAQAKASVILKLRGTRQLPPATVNGIAAFVAGSVESLRPEAVVILDSQGRPLSRTADAGDDNTTGLHLERQQRLERDLSAKVLSLLEPVAGTGHVRVNVSAALTAGQEEITEEQWDPASVVRSRQTSSDTSAAGLLAARGVAGARANAPPDTTTAATTPQPVAEPQPPAGRSTETVNYEISRTSRHTTEPAGRIARLSVAVLVDDVRVAGADGAAPSTRRREPAELERFQRLAATAVGLDEDRGDQLTVENIAFEEAPEAPVDAPAPWWQQVAPTVVKVLGVSVGDLARWLLIAVVALVALLGVLRPMLKQALVPGAPVAALVAPAPAAALGAPPGALPAAAADDGVGDVARRDSRVPALTKRIAQQAEQRPEHVAQLVRALIAQEDR